MAKLTILDIVVLAWSILSALQVTRKGVKLELFLTAL